MGALLILLGMGPPCCFFGGGFVGAFTRAGLCLLQAVELRAKLVGLLVDLLLDHVLEEGGVSGQLGIHEVGGLDSGGTIEVLADLLGDSTFTSLSFAGGELHVPAVNKNDGHE